MTIKKILEAHYDTYKYPNGATFDIFVNPKKKEILETLKQYKEILNLPKIKVGVVRWIADNESKKFYIFHGSELHLSAMKKIGMPVNNSEIYNKNIITGIIQFNELTKPYKYTVITSHVNKEKIKKDFNWVKKYFYDFNIKYGIV